MRFTIVGVCLSVAGCGGVEVKPYEPDKKVGYSTCRDISTSADTASMVELGFGIVSGIVAGGLVVAGGLAGPDPDGGNFLTKNRGAALSSSGALLATIPIILLTRSDAASTAAGATYSSMKLDDRIAYNTCVDAYAEYVSKRSEASAVQLQREKERTAEADKLLQGYNALGQDALKKILEAQAVPALPSAAAVPQPPSAPGTIP